MSNQNELRLRQGVKTLGLTLNDRQISQLLAYLELLQKWNRAYNLTAIRDPLQMVTLHLLDSLSIVPFIDGNRIIDVGTGPGLPGIPLAICYPQKQFTLLDSNGKKTRFLQQVRQELALENIEVINGRVEQHAAGAGYEIVISRAFASLADMLHWCGDICSEEGAFLAMKGVYPQEEIASMPKGFVLDTSHALRVPGCDAQRHLIVIQREKV